MMKITNILVILFVICVSACQVIDENERYISVQGGETGKSVVLVDFSGIGCVNCPTAAQTVHELLEAYPDNLIAVEMHPASNSFTKTTEPQYDYTCEAADTYYKFFGGTSTTPFPTGVVDFVQQADGSYFTDYSSWASQLVKRAQTMPEVNVAIVASQNKGKEIADITISSKENINVQLLLWVLEDSIVGIQKTTSGALNDYVRNHLLRGTLTGDWGENLQLISNDTMTICHDIVLPEVCKRENCSIAAIVINSDTKEVINAAKCKLSEQQDPFTLYYNGIALSNDTTIKVNTIIKDLFGDYMECSGMIEGNGMLNVDITRSEVGLEDELCINMCAAGNGELFETKTYTLNGSSEWYAHFYPKKADMSTITYRFYNTMQSLTLSVQFDATEN